MEKVKNITSLELADKLGVADEYIDNVVNETIINIEESEETNLILLDDEYDINNLTD